MIPARYASSRFPGKPLALIAGKPLVIRVYERVAALLPPPQVLVATEDQRIAEVCEKSGVRVAMTSPKCPTGTDRLWEAMRRIPCEIIVNVQGDEPLVNPQDILAVISEKHRFPNHVINAMCPITEQADIESPKVPKVVTNESGEMVYMSRAPIPFPKTAGVAAAYRRQAGIYAFNPRELEAFARAGRRSLLERVEDIEILRFLNLGIPVRMVEVSGGSVAVDIPEDISRVEKILQLPPV